jgi:hypothetical protein
MSVRSQRITRTPGPRRVAGKRRAAVEPAAVDRRRRGVRRPVAWFAATVLTTLGALVAQVLTGIPGQLLDVQAWADRLRTGDDMDYSVNLESNSYSLMVATPSRFELAPDNRMLNGDLGLDATRQLFDDVMNAGGYVIYQLEVQVLLEGRRNQQIQIVGVNVVDIRSGPPVKGTYFESSEGGGEPHEMLAFDLSENAPVARKTTQDGTPGQPYFEDTGISLKDREQVALTARFSYRPDAAVEFRLRIEYVIGGKSKQMMIDNSGSPFRVSSWHCSDRQGAAVLDYESAYTNQEGEPGELIFAAQPDPHHLYGFACA